MAHGIALINLGCRVNRVELDLMADSLLRMGCRIVEEDEAQAIVINTCAVTAEAEAKTRKAVRKAALMPGAPLVVATGCVASLFADELASLAPNVVVEAEKDKVADKVLEELGFAPESVSDDGLVISKPTPTGRTRPGIKIQDGCDNRCTFCIVWKARGAGRSLDPREVVSQVEDAMSRGAQEVVLTGINLGSYKAQLEDEGRRILRLPDLLEYVLEKTEVGRLRLSSLEPPDVNARLVEVIATSNGRIAPFLHICLQSGCDATLARMGRVYRTELYRKAVEEARSVLPTIALGTDLIVGFPGETDKEFDESYEFCRQMGFSKMHVFRYSKRPGTPAATAPNQVDPKVMAERAKKMRDLGNAMRFDAAKKLVGTCDNVVVQYPGRGISGGLFDVQVDPTIELDELIAMRFDEVLPNGTLKATRL